jgi:hypothetical protein
MLPSSLPEQGHSCIGGVVRGGAGAGNDPVFFDDRGGVLVDGDHGGEGPSLNFYRRDAAKVEGVDGGGDFGLHPGGRPFSSALNRIRANFTVFPQASCAAIFPAGGF